VSTRDERARLRARLVSEEFIDLLEAIFDVTKGKPMHPEMCVLKRVSGRVISDAAIRDDLPDNGPAPDNDGGAQ
jgi:hypothetical protein